MMKHCYSCYFW